MSYLRNEEYTGWVPYGSSIIYPQGNVGIGTNNPKYSIDVVGDINFTGTFRQNGTAYVGSQWTTSGANIYYNTGNVGIGTATNLTNALNVNGTVSATSFSGGGTGLTGTASSLNVGGTAAGLSATLAINRGGTGATTTSQNFVFAGPTSGSGAPSFRALASGDIPANAANTSGTAAGLSGSPSITVATVTATSFSGPSTSLLGAYFAGTLAAGFSVVNGGSGAVPWNTGTSRRITVDATLKIFTFADLGLYIIQIQLNSDFAGTGNLAVNLNMSNSAGNQNSEWSTTWNGATEFKAFYFINVTSLVPTMTFNLVNNTGVTVTFAAAEWSRIAIYRIA